MSGAIHYSPRAKFAIHFGGFRQYGVPHLDERDDKSRKMRILFMQPTIDLATPRTICLMEGERTYSFHFARIGEELWKEYFRAIDKRERLREGKIEPIVDLTASRGVLLEKALQSAEGYTLPEGKQITDIENWKQKLPAAHRAAICGLLTNWDRATLADDEAQIFGLDSVALRCIWTANEAKQMVRVPRLVHRFETPTFEQERRYRRENSRSIIVGGSRYSGETVYPATQLVNIALYDEMIQSVEGYVVNGRPIEGRDAIAREMDAFHKCVAVDLLFNPPDLTEAKAEEEVAIDAA